MVDYTIVPRGRAYWIEAVEKDGSRRVVERHNTEDAAVRHLRALNEWIEMHRALWRQGQKEKLERSNEANVIHPPINTFVYRGMPEDQET